MDTLFFFILITVLNIVTATIKTVMMVKSGPIAAGLISTINATINAVSTLVISRQQDTMVVILVTLIANAIAVPGTKILLEKIQKDKLWVYNATIKCSHDTIESLRTFLKDEQGIHSTWTAVADNQLYDIKVFVYTKNDSRIVKRELQKLNAKYHIIEPM